VSRYLSGYPAELIAQVETMIGNGRMPELLLKRYPEVHQITNSRALYDYTQDLKSQYLRQSPPLSKVEYDDKIDVIHNALGLHAHISRVQGNKLKAKKEIRIASLFRQTPEAFLRMIVVHELAHIREKDHNKAFYKLCQHMEPDYHQLEFDLRVYLTCVEHFGPLY
jgi:predicted metal-dependent hydrolase